MILIATVDLYNAPELWGALRVIARRGLEFEIVSSDNVIQDESLQQRHRAHGIWTDTQYKHQGLVVVSGDPEATTKMWYDKNVERLVKAAHEAGTPIAAICAAVPVIRHVAEGKKVAGFPLVKARQLLEDAGAEYTTLSLCIDPPLVTAETQMRTEQWAEAFCDLVEGKQPSNELVDSGFVPRGKPRRPIKGIEHLLKEENE